MMKLLVFTLTVLTVYVDAQTKCPLGFFAADGSCWSVPHQKFKWTEAESACRSFHGDLAVITDRQVLFDLQTAIRRSHGDKFWIAATDMLVEGDWLWAPKDKDGVSQRVNLQVLGQTVHNNDKDKNCMYLDKDHHGVYAEQCEEEQYLICEHDPLSIGGGTSVVG